MCCFCDHIINPGENCWNVVDNDNCLERSYSHTYCVDAYNKYFDHDDELEPGEFQDTIFELWHTYGYEYDQSIKTMIKELLSKGNPYYVTDYELGDKKINVYIIILTDKEKELLKNNDIFSQDCYVYRHIKKLLNENEYKGFMR